DLPLRPGKGHMVGGMAGCSDSFQLPARAFDNLAVFHRDIRPEVAVGAGLRIVLLALIARPRGAMRPFGIDGGASRGLDPRGVRRMVAMGVRDEDVRHGLAPHGIQQRLRMRLAIGTGIDDRDLALPEDVADGPGESERARIIAEHAAHARPRLFDDAGLEREVAIEGNVVVSHGSSFVIPGHRAAMNPESGGRGKEYATRFRVRAFGAPRNDEQGIYENAWMPVMARPKISAWTSWVPS